MQDTTPQEVTIKAKLSGAIRCVTDTGREFLCLYTEPCKIGDKGKVEFVDLSHYGYAGWNFTPYKET